jgi:hypothetical protein
LTSFNLFDKLRYLPTFFGNWTLIIIPTLENMIMKVVCVGNAGAIVPANQCTHVNKEMAFQSYSVRTHCRYTASAGDPDATWIMLTPQGYTIRSANFYTSQF